MAATFFIAQKKRWKAKIIIFWGEGEGFLCGARKCVDTLFSISCPIALTVPDAPVPFGLGYLLPLTIIGLNCRGEKRSESVSRT